MYAVNGTLTRSTTMEMYSPDDVMLYTRPMSATNGGADAAMAISNFHIQLDNMNNALRPGEEISGKVIMDVWSSVPIRFVEFLLQGRGTVQIFKSSTKFKEQPASEIYLEKAIHLITPPEGARNVVLTPGKYVTKFNYRLAEDLPPSVPGYDMGQGFIFDISYMAKANVAADISSQHISPTTMAHVVKIIKSTKKIFTVLPAVDWSAIPGAIEPIAHAEQITTCCSLGDGPTSVLFKADQTIYPIGDIIKFQVEVLSPRKKHVSGVSVELEQEITYFGKQNKKFRQVLMKAFDKTKRNYHKMVRAKFSMPLPPALIPSFIPNCSVIKVTYCLKITVSLKGLGGKIMMQIPLTIAPPTGGSHKTETDGPVPVFNKPIMQFPYFSKSPLEAHDNMDSVSQGTLRSQRSVDRSSYYSASRSPHGLRHSQRDPKVITRYKNGLGLCAGCGGCCGSGIHN